MVDLLKERLEKIRRGELGGGREYPTKEPSKKQQDFGEMLMEDAKRVGTIEGNTLTLTGIKDKIKIHVGKIENTPETEKELKRIIQQYYGKRDLATQLLEIQPIFYDTSRIWWAWDNKEFRWKIIDETAILNFVNQLSMANTIESKERNEILEALKQEARLNEPKPIQNNWIQFKETIVDINTGEEIKATPKYFVTNPIPFQRHPEKFIETPNMDKIFTEWVGKENIKILYEILAYCTLPSYPIHRLFCFIGDGMNGKSCFLRLLKKFTGAENITSTELDTLLTSRFEITRLHKKLVCVMGETNFSEISKTSIIKKLTGQDTIGFEYKNKDPFEGENYAKILIATNNLPTTTDKTLGFYRRWTIIDFPNRFSEEKDILSDIPDEEYESLALKCQFIIKELLEKRKFTNEGTIEERQEKYEAKSNFLDKFIDLFVIENVDGYITKSNFFKQFSAWCIENRHRQMSETSLGIEMKKKGVDGSTKHFNWMNDGKGGTGRVWLGISWKNK